MRRTAILVLLSLAILLAVIATVLLATLATLAPGAAAWTIPLRVSVFGHPIERLIVRLKIAFEITQGFLPHIRRIPDHRIEPARLENLRKRSLPVEHVDTLRGSVVESKLAVVEIRADQ